MKTVSHIIQGDTVKVWRSISEAAAALSMSDKSVAKRISDGTPFRDGILAYGGVVPPVIKPKKIEPLPELNTNGRQHICRRCNKIALELKKQPEKGMTKIRCTACGATDTLWSVEIRNEKPVAVAKTVAKPEVPVEKNEWREIPADVNPNDIVDVDVNETGEIVGVEDYADSIMVRLDSIIMYYRHSGGATLELEDYMFTFTGTVMEEQTDTHLTLRGTMVHEEIEE